MKITAILIFAFLMQVSAAGLAQKVTLNERNASLESVIDKIRSQTGYEFMFNVRDVDNAKKVNVNVKGRELSEVLELVFEGQDLNFSVKDRFIVLKPKEVSLFDRFSDAVKGVFANIYVRGVVRNENGEIVERITVIVKGTNNRTTTNAKGEFLLKGVNEDATLVFSGVSIETYELAVKGKKELNVNVRSRQVQLREVAINTGYQTLSKEKAIGSFELIDNKLLNRKASTNILERLDGIASGVIFTKNAPLGSNNPVISVRGRSTLFSNANPLIILDNFPYNGKLENINPNDIENVTILKDAAAASIWGAFSGNGVIVLTSKKGNLNQTPKISLNSNVTIAAKPDLFYRKQLSSREAIEVERFLFDKGAYDIYLQYLAYLPQSPVVDILEKKRNGQLNPISAEQLLSELENRDMRSDLLKHFYRNAINQQYSLNVSGGGSQNQYFISGGYDKNLNSVLGNDLNRLTLNARNSFYLLNNRLEIGSGVIFSNTQTNSTGSEYSPKYAYEKFVDENGNALPTVKDYRLGFVDTVGKGKLLDWRYYPLNEKKSIVSASDIDYKIDANLSYTIITGLKASIFYQYGRGIGNTTTEYSQSSYYYRNLYNQFTTLSPSGLVTNYLPKGNILINGNGDYSNYFIRTGLSYNRVFNGKHELSSIIGWEQRRLDSFGRTYGLYGYDPSTATNVPVSYTVLYPQFFGGDRLITDDTRQGGSADRFRSYYFNASYSYDGKYTVSASARKDESNLFGVKSNQKGVPLWSAGIGWSLSKEGFYKIAFIPSLKLRASYGYTGNVDRSAFAGTTINVGSSVGVNQFGQPLGEINNPPNPSLRWEKVKTINLGVDFNSKNSIVGGSIELYSKAGIDLIGYSPVAPQTGVSRYRGNVASTETRGIDIVLHTKNIDAIIKWNTNFLFSIVKDKVTKNEIKLASNFEYVSSNYSNPLEGKPYNAIFAFKWAGLDGQGNPQSYLDGQISTDYSNILSSTNINELKYIGSAIPNRFGSFRNNFGFKGIEISFNITYRGGYYFKRRSLDYQNLFANGFSSGEYEYSHRWQKPGDEMYTNVPSLLYPVNPNREQVYLASEILVEKADHLRLEDVQLSFAFPKAFSTKLSLSNLHFYSNVNNLGVLWKANNKGIDPNFGDSGVPTPKTYVFGIKADF